MTDFANTGAQCALPSCRQQDFLPFKCSACASSFCLEHRTFAAHSCPRAAASDVQVFVCPLCAGGIRLTAGATADALFAQHERSPECARARAARAADARAPTCGAPRCKKKLAPGLKTTCAACRREFCSAFAVRAGGGAPRPQLPSPAHP
jgi:hypothetical protein